MTEPTDSPLSPRAPHPGDLVRSAREARGWTLSHLSMLLKLSERRLQAFEQGRWDDVGDRTFVRALAQSLARHLSIDPVPLLQALPQSAEVVVLKETSASRAAAPVSPMTLPGSGGRRSSARSSTGSGIGALLRRPAVVAGAVILLAAAALAFAPSSWWQSTAPTPTEVVVPLTAPTPVESPAAASEPQGAASAASLPVGPAIAPSPPVPSEPAASSAPSAPVTTKATTAATAPTKVASASAPPPAVTQATAREVPPEPSGPWGTGSTTVVPTKNPTRPTQVNRAADEPALRLTINQASWVQVTDAQGQVLVSRLIPAGEKVELVGARPLNLRVGNVSGVQAQWRGQPIDLQAYQRSNVAQLELP